MGSKQVTRDDRLKQVRAWVASGEPVERYARRIRVKASTLSWWRWKLRSEGVSLEAKAPRKRRRTQRPLTFVEVTASPRDVAVGPTPRIELEIDEVKVGVPEGFDEPTLARVLGLLRSAR